MLQKAKTALRITAPVFDEEIADLLEAAKVDLSSSGVMVNEEDKLVQRAMIVYCKANFGLENPDFVKFTDSYEMLKTKLMLASDFNGS